VAKIAFQTAESKGEPTFPAFGYEVMADKDTAEEHRLYLLTHADRIWPQWVATQ
jgi:hypothetical protein